MSYNGLVHSILDPTHLAKTFGVIGIFITIFLESGIIFFFFLPGDSLLFASGLLASEHYLNIFLVIIAAVAGAILGNNAGYYTGKKAGENLFTRKESLIFSRHRVTEAHEFFKTQGAKALVLARFVPAIRTFVPIVAGVGEMNYRYFLKFNAIGALIWGVLMPLLGFTLGKTVHGIDKYILPVIALIVVVSVLPVVLHYFKKRKVKHG
jgi:membrane-associated protein